MVDSRLIADPHVQITWRAAPHELAVE